MSEQTQSSSAYASAESSPSLTPSSSSQTNFENLLDFGNINQVLENDENHKKLMSELVSFVQSQKQSQTKGSSSSINDKIDHLMQSQSLKGDVKTIVSTEIKNTMEELAKQSPKAPSPSKQSSVMSFIGKMLNKKPSAKGLDGTQSTAGNQTVKTALSVTSSSSPNPDCSPFKLLASEMQQKEVGSNMLTSTNKLGTLSPNGSTINDAVAIFNAATKSTDAEKQSKPVCNTSEPLAPVCNASEENSKSDKLIEKLASLNHREHEKADPILTSHKTLEQQQQTSNALPSSHEFFNDLNFNLAVAAAASSAAPVAVVAPTTNSCNNKSQQSNQRLLNDRFTSNASTSSIHNDLKIILEESKESKMLRKKVEQSGGKQQQQQQQQTQRHHQGNKVNDSELEKLLVSMIESKKSLKELILENDCGGRFSDGKLRYSREFLNQIREKRSGLIKTILPDTFKVYCSCMSGKHWDPEKYFDMVNYGAEQPSSATSNNKNSKSSYFTSYKTNINNKQMLQMNGSSMDSPQPILQVPKNTPRSQHHTQQYYPKHSNQKEKKTLMNNSNMSTGSSSNKEDDNSADKMLLNLLKKSNTNKPASNNNILDMLNKNTSKNNSPPKKSTTTTPTSNSKQAKTKTTPNTNTNNIVLEGLFSKINQHMPPPQPQVPRHFPQVLTVQELEMNQQLSSMKKKSPSPKNKKPQHNHQKKSNNVSGSNNTSTASSCSTTTSANTSTTSTANESYHFDPANNLSDAYKQLVKNLNNHPLSTPPTNAKLVNEDLLAKLKRTVSQNVTSTSPLIQILNSQFAQQQKQQQIENDTNNLKQILNLNHKVGAEEKKSKPKHRHHHHHHHSKSSKSNLINELKFPMVNPHEKPFLSLMADNCVQMPTNPIENLVNKMNSTQSQSIQLFEQQNFNILIKKLMPSLSNQMQYSNQIDSNNKSEDILRWFNGANSNVMNQYSMASSTSTNGLSKIELTDQRLNRSQSFY